MDSRPEFSGLPQASTSGTGLQGSNASAYSQYLLAGPALSHQTPMAPTNTLLDYFDPKFPLLAVAQFANTLTSSVHLTDDDAVKNLTAKYWPDAYQYWLGHEGAIQLVGEGGGMFLPGLLAVKALRTSSAIGRIIDKVPLLRGLVVNEQRIAKTEEALRAQQLTLAESGELGSAIKPTWKNSALARDVMKQAVMRGVKEATAFELGVGVTMNQSDFLYPTDAKWYDYVAYVGAIAVPALALETLAARKVISEAGRATARVGHDAINPGFQDLDGIIVRPGNEDVAATALRIHRDELKAASALDPTDAKYRSVADRFKSTNDARVDELLQSIAKRSDGYGTHTMSPSTVLSRTDLDHWQAGLDSDPTTALGVKNIGTYDPVIGGVDKLKDNYTKMMQDLEDAITTSRERTVSKRRSAKEKMAARDQLESLLNTKKKFTEMFPLTYRNTDYIPREVDFHIFPDVAKNSQNIVRTQQTGEPAIYAVDAHLDPSTGEKLSVGIGADFTTYLPKNTTYADIADRSTYARSVMFSLYDRVISNLAESKASIQNFKIGVTSTDHWMRLDAIDEALRREVIKDSDITFPAGQNIASMRKKILEGKYADFISLYEKQAKQQMSSPLSSIVSAMSPQQQAAATKQLAGQGFSFGGNTELNDSAIRYMLNLPKTAFGEISPLEELFHSFRAQTEKDLSKYNTQEIIDQTLKVSHFPKDLANITKSAGQHAKDEYGTLLRGNSFAPMKTTKGDYVVPLTVWRAKMTQDQFTKQALDNDMLLRRGMVLNTLTGVFKDPNTGKIVTPDQSVVSKLVSDIKQMDAYQISTQVDLLNDASRRSQGAFAYQTTATRDDPVNQAGHQIQSYANHTGASYKNALYAKPYDATRTRLDVIASIRAKNNDAALARFADYVRARRMGWTLLPDAVKTKDKFSFVLDHENDFNQNRFKALYGRELQKGELMPEVSKDMKYIPMEVPSLTHDMAQVVRSIGDDLLPEQNKLFAGMGERHIRRKEWWIPPPMYYGKEVAYVMQKWGDDTIKRTLVANTRQELEEMKNSEEIQAILANQGGIIRDRSDIEKYYTARSKNFFELLDAGDPLVKQRAAAKGTASTPYRESGHEITTDILNSFSRQVDNIVTDSLQLLYEPQLSYVARLHNVYGTGGKATSIWDQYKRTLLGERAISEKDFALTRSYNLIEGVVNDKLKAYWDMTNQHGISGELRQAGKDLLAKAGYDIDAKRFERLKAEIGPTFDFNNVTDFVHSRWNVKPPPTYKGMTAELSHLTSTLVLRFLNLSQPLLNMSGLLATAPVVIKALRPRAGESFTAWTTRSGYFSTLAPSGTTKPGWYAYSAVRHGVSALWDFFTPEGRRQLAYAERRGSLIAPVSEIHATLDNVQRSADALPQLMHYMVQKGSWLSDKSEDLSRAISYNMGARLAKEHGIMGEQNIDAAANKFANDVIGDYRTANRPAMFQGAVGMPLGLFQTYMWNYWSRMLGYIENKQVKHLAMQYAIQASVFGGVSVPGFQTWMDIFHGGGESGRMNPIDSIQQRFGHDMADLVLYGSISSIPKIFAPDGIAMYSRGDTSPRVPNMFDPLQTPIANFATSTMQMLGAAWDQMAGAGGQGLSKQQIMEMFGTYMNNRFVRGMSEVLAGYSVDQRGNVITNDVRSWFPVLARVIGVRPLSEAKAMDALRRQQVTESFEQVQRARMALAIKSAFRGGSFDSETFVSALETYARTSGNPQYFPRFLKTAMVSALTPKAEVKFTQMLKSNTRLLDAIRLMNANVMDDFQPQSLKPGELQ